MRRLFTFVCLFVIACLQVSVVHAESGDIVIGDGWARASIGVGSNSAAYFTITLDGNASDRLVAAATDAAERAELHNHLMEDGVARMRPVDAIDVAPGEKATLEPGGLHIMLMGLKDELEPGATLPLTLIFEKAGEIAVELPVQPIGHRPKTHDHGDG